MTPEEEIVLGIQQRLMQCDGVATPTICRTIQTEAGMTMVIEMVINLINNEGMETVDECLPHIEQTLSNM